MKNFYFDTINQNVVPIIEKEISSVLTAEDFFVVRGVRMQPSAFFTQKIEVAKKVLVDFIQEINLGELLSINIWDAQFAVVSSDNEKLVGLSFPNDRNIAKAYRGDSIATIDRLHFQDPQNAFKIYLPVKNAEDQVLGVVELDYSISSFQTAINRIALLIASAMTVGIFILALLIILLFRIFISKPINTLRRATYPISRGELGNYIQIQQRDEVGDLAQDFNLMIKGLNNLSGEVTRLKEVDKIKSEFLSVAAHQLRTPLSAMRWALQKVLRSIRGENATLIRKIKKQDEKMIKIVNDMLNAMRIEEVGLDYEFQRVDLIALLDTVVEVYENAIEEKKLHFSFLKGSFKDLYVHADLKKLEIVFTNLLANAVAYTRTGGVIKIEIEKSSEFVIVKVQDNGVGIQKKDVARIFTKFFRAKNAISAQPDGLGIGLFLTKSIVEAHHGKVWVESKIGKGTIFYIKLPLKRSDQH
ncbi:HAMP domain-containing histidine kinase [Patescibacteria group bacterium]|nr:HAMP domain-containing histidine kinase [Patescibacteria group bacterium]